MNDAYAATLALRATGVLADFNRAGVLSAADVHVARRLGALGGEPDEQVLLAVALTVRSTRHGSVVLDLDTAEQTTSPDADVDEAAPTAPLTWPTDWAQRCAASPLVGGPVQLRGSRMWLTRYWEQEEQVADELLARTARLPVDLDPARLSASLLRLFPDPGDADQRTAAAVCALSRVSVLAGGPGTGKTTTVSRLLALLREQHPHLRVALAAPTGKAAARLEEAVRSSTRALAPSDAALVGDLAATTLHRLLGWRPDARSRFRHDASNRLPADVVVVDEASMVPLTMMARLLEALRPSARLVLVGDPDQLASVEAGAVLGDLVDGARQPARTARMAAALEQVLPPAATATAIATAAEATGAPDTPHARLRDGIALLATNRRFSSGGAIAELAEAVQRGDAEKALGVLRSRDRDVVFEEVGDDSPLTEDHLRGLRSDVVTAGLALERAAAEGRAADALDALERHRVLCAHRTGPRGVQHWSSLAARWVAEASGRDLYAVGHRAGEPLLVTENDYEVGLYNGDTGAVVSTPSGLVAVFGRGGEPVTVPLARLGSARPLHAMTVHRSQGSQFDRVSIVLPAAGSPLATRETLYTAVTRATSGVRVIGSAAAVAEAVDRPAARATGLRERLASAQNA
ncbi:DNA helicase/exodeoxyribonuclease V alpha subunit [Motilibacter peucedani]|uniref:RecBCD enzyme subunit RecD n=1 Tax=Motilibacter peucedani TaxID=598650 RepID=A0A420XRC0_9ACTN|nr:exodeoxyribonuclease V subunit alpha [Motilibacter peucedani]RKS77453.1 DNA helicase/exodeoxyribonuclease V alpha subunit [Motilibacter peucedani]